MEDQKHPKQISIGSYDYPLPDNRIAQFPLEIRDRSRIDNVTVRGRAIEYAHIVITVVDQDRIFEDISRGEDFTGNERLPEVFPKAMVHGDRTDPEMIVVAESLIPRDRLIKPCRLVRFLIIDGVGSYMSTRTWGDDLAVKDIDIPP